MATLLHEAQAMPAVAEALHALQYVDQEQPDLCKQVPSLFSSFVDAFVDYAVGGQVLTTNNNLPPSVDPKALDPAAAVFKLDDAPPSIVVSNEEAGLRTWLPPAQRLIAIGDIHGDLAKARAALHVAEVIDENDRWIGGETVVVQVCRQFLHTICRSQSE